MEEEEEKENMNCGMCGRPVYNGEPICDGCKKSRSWRGEKDQKKLDLKDKKKEREDKEEEEDAQAVWFDEE